MDQTELIAEIKKRASEDLVSNFVPGKTYIPATFPQLLPEDVEAVAQAMFQYWYTEWKQCAKFERELTKVMDKQFALLVNSGSSASLIAMTSALKARSTAKAYVLTTAVGFPTTVAPIYQNNRAPIYVDMTPELTPNLEQIESILKGPHGDEVDGAIFAHTLGFPYDEEYVRTLLGSDRFLISDCCDALGARLPDGSPVGSYSDFATLSFFPAHHVMAGEGGAVLTNDKHLNDIATSLSNWGRSCYCRPGESNTCGHRFDWQDRGNLPEGWDHKYIFDNLGYNLKMTEFQGALGYSQIQRLDSLVQARKLNYTYLYEQLNRPENLKYLQLIPPYFRFSPFGFPILASDPFIAKMMIAYLEDHKVGTRRLFGGNLLRQPAFMNRFHREANSLKVSDEITERMFWISVSPSLNQSMLDYMVYTIDNFLIESAPWL